MQIYNLSIHFLQMIEYEQPGLSKLSVWLLTRSIHSADSQLNLGKHFGEATSHQVPLFTLGLKTGNITLKIHLGDMSECGSQALVFVITGPSFSISLSKKTGFC